jgi:hypothetical protein
MDLLRRRDAPLAADDSTRGQHFSEVGGSPLPQDVLDELDRGQKFDSLINMPLGGPLLPANRLNSADQWRKIASVWLMT